MSKSLIKRVPNPFTGSNTILEYYTSISFIVDTEKVEDMVFKVDTGSSYTVISSDMPNIEHLSLIDDNNIIDTKVYDASDKPIQLYKMAVNDFQLTEDITFKKVEIYITDMLHRKAILGLDMLSLFSFQYLQEPNQIKGTFWINNYEQSMKRYKDWIDKNDNCLCPRNIMVIEEEKQNEAGNIQE